MKELHAVKGTQKSEQYGFSGYSTDKQRRKYLKKVSKEGMGIDTLLLIEPEWKKFDTRVGNQYINSEKQTALYSRMLYENAAQTGLALATLSPKEMAATDVEKFNELVLLKDYFAFLSSSFESNAVYFDIEKLNKLMLKYHTSKIGLMGINTIFIKKNPLKVIFGVLGSAFVVTIPYMMYYAFAPEYVSTYTAAVLDIKNNRLEFVDDFAMGSKTKEWFIQSKTYDYFRSFHKQKKD